MNRITLLDKPTVMGPHAVPTDGTVVIARPSADGTLGRKRLVLEGFALATPKTAHVTLDSYDDYVVEHKGRPAVYVVGTAAPLTKAEKPANGPKAGEKPRNTNTNVNPTRSTTPEAEGYVVPVEGALPVDVDPVALRGGKVTKAAAADVLTSHAAALRALADATETLAQALR